MKEPLVSVVVTSYRRLDHLRRTMNSFEATCTYQNLELILCDDGSPVEMQQTIRESVPFDVYLFGAHNSGLGTSLNRGLRAARGKYILYLQDDWVCERRCDYVQESIEALKEIPKLGVCKLTMLAECFRVSELVSTSNGLTVRLAVLDQPNSYDGIYVYSQTPHIKPREFHERLGYFREDAQGGTGIEDQFARNFLDKNLYRVGQVAGHEGLFRHIGDDISFFRGKGRWRNNLRTKIVNNTLSSELFKVYKMLPDPVRMVLRGTPRRAFKK